MLTVDRVAGAGLAVFALFVLWQSRALPLGSVANPGPAYMPMVLAALLLLGGIAVAVLGGNTPRLGTLDFGEWRHAVAIFAACAFAALGLERLGYRLTILVVLLFLLGVVERKRVSVTVVFAVAFAVGTFLLFDTLLRVPLPRGPLGI
ncbi:MAG TPA: tripartite tricarboxylate transporter TctB family protein [Methylomirabilota bacterium]|jgi:putative tricarboxylic transport membrane protein